MSQDDFDPIALLQSLGGAAPASSTADQAASGAADDLFAGSEPVDVQAATVAAQVAQVVAPPAEQPEQPAVANLSQDGVIRLLQEALLALHTRVAAIERHATRNGWPL